MSTPIEGRLDARGMKMALVVSRFHDTLTSQLLHGAADCLVRHGLTEEELAVHWVPGTFEIPLVAQQLARSGKHDAVICLGNSFTHLHDENDRRKSLAEYYATLRHDGILIMDHRNYDAILDNKAKPKRNYYYGSDRVTASPEYVDESLARFCYKFDDGDEYHLNMFPLRHKYVSNLMKEVGFQDVTTYGDFQEDFKDSEPDFFVHVASKKYVEKDEE